MSRNNTDLYQCGQTRKNKPPGRKAQLRGSKPTKKNYAATSARFRYPVTPKRAA